MIQLVGSKAHKGALAGRMVCEPIARVARTDQVAAIEEMQRITNIMAQVYKRYQ